MYYRIKTFSEYWNIGVLDKRRFFLFHHSQCSITPALLGLYGLVGALFVRLISYTNAKDCGE